MTLAPRNLGPVAFALTRLGAVLFGPGQPLQPVAQEQQPRQFPYPTGVNMVWQPRQDVPGLAAFDLLRALNKKHALAALCVRVRGQQIMALRGGVVAKRKQDQAAENSVCDALNAFFSQPDGATPRASWLQMLIRDLLEIDAPTVYKRPSRGGGLAALDVIDGATIKPLLDDRGRTVAYQQVLYGLALSQYRGRRVGPTEEEVIGEYAPGELWYQPYTVSTTSPYGRPPMEDLISLANIYLQKLDYDLKHFTEGNIPAALGVFDGATLDVQQVAQFEEHFNAAIQGDPSRMAKIRFIPFPVKVERLSQLSTGGQYESLFEERNVKIVCGMYGVTPSEIGFTADVNRATADAQEHITYRLGIRPLCEWLKVTLFDPLIQRDFGQAQLEWAWDFGESADRLMLSQVHASDIAAGVISAQESRTMRYPDLQGEAPGPPQPPAGGAPGSAPALPGVQTMQARIHPAVPSHEHIPLEKARGDDAPEDEAERSAAETAMLGVVSGYFAQQLTRLREQVQQHGANVTAQLTAFWQAEQPALVRALMPFGQKTLTTAAEHAMGQLAIGVDWELVNADVLTLARSEATRLATQVTATTQAQAATLIADWIETGGTLDELSEALTALYPEPRARMIAATEVTRLYATGNAAAWKASGVVSKLEWMTAADERVCPICGVLDGTTYDIEAPERMPPAHPSCRCWLAPVVMSPEEFKSR